MIVKIVGMHNGNYREKMFDDVIDYLFTRDDDSQDAQMVFSGDAHTPYSHLLLTFNKREPISILFNTKAYIMSETTAKTVDVLGHRG
jgi:hypothetical protein